MSELERFHKYMTEKRTELKQIGTAKKAREDAEKKAANSTVEEAADEDAGEGAPIVSPVPGSPRDVDPGRNKTNRLLQQALMKHRVVKRLDHSRFRSSSSRGSVEEGAAEQVAAAIEASQPREEEERPFDIDDFDDQRFGHLKKIFLKHRDKILESRSTIDKATEQVKVVQDELMRSLREDEEDLDAWPRCFAVLVFGVSASGGGGGVRGLPCSGGGLTAAVGSTASHRFSAASAAQLKFGGGG